MLRHNSRWEGATKEPCFFTPLHPLVPRAHGGHETGNAALLPSESIPTTPGTWRSWEFLKIHLIMGYMSMVEWLLLPHLDCNRGYLLVTEKGRLGL